MNVTPQKIDHVNLMSFKICGLQGSSYAGRGRPPLTISARHYFFFFLCVPFFAKDTHHTAREQNYFLEKCWNLYIATLLVAQP